MPSLLIFSGLRGCCPARRQCLAFVRRNRLTLHVFANSLNSGFPTDAALLDAAVGRQVVDRAWAMRIDPHLSSFDFSCNLDCAIDIAAPDRAAQAVDGFVGA